MQIPEASMIDMSWYSQEGGAAPEKGSGSQRHSVTAMTSLLIPRVDHGDIRLFSDGGTNSLSMRAPSAKDGSSLSHHHHSQTKNPASLGRWASGWMWIWWMWDVRSGGFGEWSVGPMWHTTTQHHHHHHHHMHDMAWTWKMWWGWGLGCGQLRDPDDLYW
ncbi:hypothetical protein B7494_g5571 [Chlorociboria aeruginascens]|nr:hypothetical protein B7494_g5571 [Chlorociboria aeruginascens]